MPLTFTLFHLRNNCTDHYGFFFCVEFSLFFLLCLSQQFLPAPCLLGSNLVNFHCLGSVLRPETLANKVILPQKQCALLQIKSFILVFILTISEYWKRRSGRNCLLIPWEVQWQLETFLNTKIKRLIELKSVQDS